MVSDRLHDSAYIPLAEKLLESLRGAGRFDGDVAIITHGYTVGAGIRWRLAMTKYNNGLRDLSERRGARLIVADETDHGVWEEPFSKRRNDVYGKEIQEHQRQKSDQYYKLTLLTDEALRAYDWLVFSDADGAFSAPLETVISNATSREGFSGVALYDPPGGMDLYSNEYRTEYLDSDPELRVSFAREVPNRTANVGSSCLMLFEVARLPPVRAIREQFRHFMRYREAFLYNDQGLFHAMFPQAVAFPTKAWHHFPVVDL